MNASTGNMTKVTWDQYMAAMYAKATIYDRKREKESKSTASSTRKVFSSETFHDAIDYESDDDDDEELYIEVFSAVLEDGLQVMKSKFVRKPRDRNGNHNRRPPRNPRTMIPRGKFPNETLRIAWMKSSDEERQAFCDAILEPQKIKKNSNLMFLLPAISNPMILNLLLM